MIDHLLVDLIALVRRSLDGALLERQAVEERFQMDVFLGDLSWETSYSLPGEEQPPRVRADLSLDWPTWSQTAYRSWSIGETPEELPEVVLEVALRVQRVAERPDATAVLAALPETGPVLGDEPLVRSAVTIEQVHGRPGDGETAAAGPTGPGTAAGPGSTASTGVGSGIGGRAGGADEALSAVRWAVEATYEGSLRFEEEQLEKPETIEQVMGGLARWVASALIRLADLPLSFLPPGAGIDD